MTNHPLKPDTATRTKEALELNADDLGKVAGGSRSTAAPASQGQMNDRFWVFYTH